MSSSSFDFSTVTDRHGTWCTQWDYVADRFGSADLLPFTISDMDFPTAPCILDALQKRLQHGVLGYSRWHHDDFLGAVAHWYQQRFTSQIDRDMVVYGPSVIYMVAQLIRQWSQPGDGVVTFTPAYDAFFKVVNGNQRNMLNCPLIKQGNDWTLSILKACLRNRRVPSCCYAARITRPVKSGHAVNCSLSLNCASAITCR